MAAGGGGAGQRQAVVEVGGLEEGVTLSPRYAITCTLHLVRQRRSHSWEEVLRAARWPSNVTIIHITITSSIRDNVEYVKAFTAQLINPNTMTEEMKVVKEAQDNLRSPSQYGNGNGKAER